MKTFKVYTKWIGYSEITVNAKDKQEAEDIASMGHYHPSNELQTGKGLNYGYEDEQVYKVIDTEENQDDT